MIDQENPQNQDQGQIKIKLWNQQNMHSNLERKHPATKYS